MKVNKLTSSKTQLPYEYYKLPFCAPNPIINAVQTLGETLSGNSIQNTIYDIKMNENESCKILCRRQYTEIEANQLMEAIDEEYKVNLLLDGLPAATSVPISYTDITYEIYEHGYRVGGIIILARNDGKEKKGAANQHFLYNHIRITVRYHNPDPESSAARVVGLKIEPFSVSHKYKGKWSDENPPKLCQHEIVHNFDGNYPQKIDGPTEVIWTYDVQWEASDIRWASRWDVYLSMNNKYDDEVHWFSIINSLLIGIFLTGKVAMIMLRTLHRDLARYNMTEEEKTEKREESAVGNLSPARRGSLMIAVIVFIILLGIVAIYAPIQNDECIDWFSVMNSLAIFVFLGGMLGMSFYRASFKKSEQILPEQEPAIAEKEFLTLKALHGDGFRKPSCATILITIIASGSQVFFMVVSTIVLCAMGLLSQAQPGSILQSLIFLASLGGFVSGFVSARIQKIFRDEDNKHHINFAIFLFPGIIFAISMGVNLVYFVNGSSSSLPAGSIISILLLWLGVSAPLTHLGAFIASKYDDGSYPTESIETPSPIPTKPWYLNNILNALIGGILVSGVVFVEFYFILSSIWLEQYYSLFGFLALVVLLLILTISEIEIILTYFNLTKGDYKWWWKPIIISGGSTTILLVYSMLFLKQKNLMQTPEAVAIYMGYMFIALLLFFLGVSAVGFGATFWFVGLIYSKTTDPTKA